MGPQFIQSIVRHYGTYRGVLRHYVWHLGRAGPHGATGHGWEASQRTPSCAPAARLRPWAPPSRLTHGLRHSPPAPPPLLPYGLRHASPAPPLASPPNMPVPRVPQETWHGRATISPARWARRPRGSRGNAASHEESPGSTGQDAGQRPGGVTRRKAPQKRRLQLASGPLGPRKGKS